MAPASTYDFFFSNLVQLMASPTSSLLLLVSFLTAAYSLLRRSRGLAPGPWGLPIVGNVPFLRHDLHQHLAELAKSYGPVMSLLLGPKTCVVITSPDVDLQGVVMESEKRSEWLDRILDDEVKQKLNKDSEAVVKKQCSTKQREDFLQVLMSLCEEGGEAKELSIPTSKPCLL